MGRIHVSPLSLGGLHALISSRLGRSFPRPTMLRIAEISGGNPFYALELARAIDAGSSRTVLPATLAELMRSGSDVWTARPRIAPGRRMRRQPHRRARSPG